MKRLFFFCLLGYAMIFGSALRGQNRSASSSLWLSNSLLTYSANVESYDSLKVSVLAPFLYEDKYRLLIGFDRLPSTSERAALQSKGIELISFFSSNLWWASLNKSLGNTELRNAGIETVIIPELRLKATSELLYGELPERVVRSAGNLDLALSVFPDIQKTKAEALLNQEGAEILNAKFSDRHLYLIRITRSDLWRFILMPWVHNVSCIPAEDQTLNYDNRGVHNAFYLKAATPGGRGLSGRGVYIGIGDDGNVNSHIDYSDRVIDRCSNPLSNHCTHVGGTMAGAGLLNPRHEGFASKASIISEYFTDILASASSHVGEFNMVLTNNSYHSVASDCSGNGYYGSYSVYADQQMRAYDTLLHLFAAGNDGGFTCTPYPASFHTTKAEWQCAKNVLTVANMDTDLVIHSSSSRGPVNDGRIKPEITAAGRNVTSTYPNNAYATLTGTSMATPTTTGSLTLLIERYRQTHSGSSPLGGLLKAIACNTAVDLGNAGPDYTYGFGMLNNRRALDAIENNTFFIASVTTGASNTHSITVPSGASELKVMLYWVDPEGDIVLANSLVNDLDLSVTDPSSANWKPWVLNPAAASVTNAALRGRDSVNNIEQVTISNPASGTYTVNVSGRVVPLGPQRYFIVYDIVMPGVTLLHPNGGDALIAGTTEYIRWDAFGGSPNTFTVQYSSNNGSTWTNIATSVTDSRRVYSWTVPAAATNQGLVRVTRNVAGYQDVSDASFVILGQPVPSVTGPCPGYVNVSWGALAGATDYQVLMKNGDSMQVIATTTVTNYQVAGLDPTVKYWFAVRGRVSGVPGIRSVAISITPSGGACSATEFNGDIAITANTAPVSGRENTSSALSATTTVSITVKNMDNISNTGPFNFSYQINGGIPVTEVYSGTIASLASYTYTFTTTANLSTPGTYVIKTWVRYTGDNRFTNDTLLRTIRQLANPAVSLPYSENFESTSASTYSGTMMGITGADRFDLATYYGPRARARTAASIYFEHGGSRALTLDARPTGTERDTVHALWTLNLAGFNAASTDIRLDAYYLNHGNTSHTNDKIWIRGNDSSPWIQVYDLFANQAATGSYKLAQGILLSLILNSNGQNFSSSTQIRFGWEGVYASNNQYYSDGYTFDDLSIYQVNNDVQMISLNSPQILNCELGSTATVNISIRNTKSTPAVNVPVSYRIDGGSVITETIANIPGLTTINYSFITTANLSAYGPHTIDVWSDFSLDDYRLNDSINGTIILNSPRYTNYPYLQGFEADNGNWIPTGTNSSWAWGTPSKTKMNRAPNGSKCWATKLSGKYNDNETSALLSPCFDLSSLTNPMLSFSHFYETEAGYDFAWVDYSTDGGYTWSKLGTAGNGLNWYNDATNTAWNNASTKWHVATYPIPVSGANMRFRFVMSSDGSVNYEGLGIDDIHIYDKTPIYNGPTNPAIPAQSLSGSSWFHFNSGGRRVASINPNGQNLGSTNVRIYLNASGIRNWNNQYYLDRNIVIRPTTQPSGNVTVRYYFLHDEALSLMNATGCGPCTTISDPYMAGVSKYSASDAEENGTVSDDYYGNWTYFTPADVTIVPYDSGYYAEYSVNSFSEMWINGGGPSQSQALPVEWLGFMVEKQSEDALLKWNTATEINNDYFEIEVARGDEALQQNEFTVLGRVDGNGTSTEPHSYSFYDIEKGKEGQRYYRIRQVDLDGVSSFSATRVLSFGNEKGLAYDVSPNPFTTQLSLQRKGHGSGMDCKYKLTDMSGRSIDEGGLPYTEEGVWTFSNWTRLMPGIYLLEITEGENRSLFKIRKQ